MANRGYKQILYVDAASDLPTGADDGQLAYILASASSVTFSGISNTWVPLGRQMVFKSGVSINAKTTGTTAIYTLPASPLYFYPTDIVMRAVNVSGTGTAPAIQIGTVTPYNNIATNSLINSVLGLLDVNNGTPKMSTFSPGLAGGAVITANVTVGALVYANFTIKFDVLGYYDTTAP